MVPESFEFAPYLVMLYIGITQSNLAGEFRKILEMLGKRGNPDRRPIVFSGCLALHPTRRAAKGYHGNSAGLPDDFHTMIEACPVVDAGRGLRIVRAPAHDVYVLVTTHASEDGFCSCNGLGIPV